MEQQKQKCAEASVELQSIEPASRSEAIKIGAKHYFTGRPCNRGHVSKRQTSNKTCVDCSREANKKHESKTSPHKLREKRRRYYSDNRESILEKAKTKRINNRDLFQKRDKESRKRRKVKISNYRRKWKKENPLNVFAHNTLSRIERAMSEERKSRCSIDCGYTQDEFLSHIESKFKDGMSWSNRSEWHIDHIKPVKAFLDEGITDIKAINALSNLQVLWASENLSKGAKYENT